MPQTSWSAKSDFAQGTLTDLTLSGTEESPSLVLATENIFLGEEYLGPTSVHPVSRRYIWGVALSEDHRFLYGCNYPDPTFGGGDHIIKIDLEGRLYPQQIPFTYPWEIIRASDGYFYITSVNVDPASGSYTPQNILYKARGSGLSIVDTLSVSGAIFVLEHEGFLFVVGERYIHKVDLSSFSIAATYDSVIPYIWTAAAVYNDVLYVCDSGGENLVALNTSDLSVNVPITSITAYPLNGRSLYVEDLYIWSSGPSSSAILRRLNRSDFSFDSDLVEENYNTRNRGVDLYPVDSDYVLVVLAGDTVQPGGITLINRNTMQVFTGRATGGNAVGLLPEATFDGGGASRVAPIFSGNKIEAYHFQMGYDYKSRVVKTVVTSEVKSEGTFISDVREQTNIYSEGVISWTQRVPVARIKRPGHVRKFVNNYNGNQWSTTWNPRDFQELIVDKDRGYLYAKALSSDSGVYKVDLETLSPVGVAGLGSLTSNTRNMFLHPDGEYLFIHTGSELWRIRTLDMTIEDTLTYSRQHMVPATDWSYLYLSRGSASSGPALIAVDPFNFSSIITSPTTDYLHTLGATSSFLYGIRFSKLQSWNPQLLQLMDESETGTNGRTPVPLYVKDGIAYSLESATNVVGRWAASITVKFIDSLTLSDCNSARFMVLDEDANQLVVVGNTTSDENALWFIDLGTFAEISGSPVRFSSTDSGSLYDRSLAVLESGISYVVGGWQDLAIVYVKQWVYSLPEAITDQSGDLSFEYSI